MAGSKYVIKVVTEEKKTRSRASTVDNSMNENLMRAIAGNFGKFQEK